MPNITLPDGSVRSYDEAVSGEQVATSIGRKLAKDAVALRLDGRLVDLNTTLTEDARSRFSSRKSRTSRRKASYFGL